MMKSYHVICINDSVEYIVVDDIKRAKIKMKELEDRHYLGFKYTYDTKRKYRAYCHWHIETVAGE